MERSVIFVSQNPTLLSNLTLSLRCLIAPFVWYHALLQTVPRALLGLLDSPFPMLAGITNEDYLDLKLTKEERQMRNWVIIDCERGESQVIRDCNPIKEGVRGW